MANGPLSGADASLDVLRTRRDQFLREYNLNGRIPTLKGLLTETVWQDYLYVDQTAKVFTTAATGTSVAPKTKLDNQYITMPTPIKKHLGAAVEQDSVHDGITMQQVMDEHASSLDADERLLNQWTMRAMLLDGQWWDATVAPPRYGNNIMASSHDHYLAYAAAGVLTLTHCNAIYRHMDEHGFGRNVVLFLNGGNIQLTGNLADWNTTPLAMTPIMEELQKAGFKALMQAGGLTIIQNDYCPLHYGVAVDLGSPRKPLAWRPATIPDWQDGLKVYRGPETAQYLLDEEYVRWVGCAVQQRSAGVAIDLVHATWVDPTTTYASTLTEWS